MLSYGFGTHTGIIRSHNEDAYLADDLLGLWVVADGMGGQNGGEIASAITIKSIDSAVKVGRSLPDAILDAHHQVLKAITVGMGHKGMGTTVVSLKVNDGNYEICWVGDSRAYLYDGSLKQLTNDHSIVQLMVDEGEITEQEARKHPARNQIYQCVGADSVDELDVCMIHGKISPGQKFLLCSDGLNDELNDKEISKIIKRSSNAQSAVDILIQAALDKGGRDNVTAIVVEIGQEGGLDLANFDIEKTEIELDTQQSLQKFPDYDDLDEEDEAPEVTLLRALESDVAEPGLNEYSLSGDDSQQFEQDQGGGSNLSFYLMVLGLIGVLFAVVITALMTI